MPDPCSARTRTLRIISIFLPPFSLDVVRSFGHNKYPIAQTSTMAAAIAVASSGVTNGGMDEVCHLPRRGRRDLAEAEARKARGRKRQEEKDYQFQSEESSHLLFLVGVFHFSCYGLEYPTLINSLVA